MKRYYFNNILLFFLIFISVEAQSQIILSEGFEGSFPPTSWTLDNPGFVTPFTQNTFVTNAIAGTKSMRCYASSFAVSNAWAFTPVLNLTTNTLYKVTYWYRGSTSSGYSEKLKITIGNAATVSSQTTVIHDYPNITSTNFAQGVDTITVSSNGNYNIGFNYYSDPNQAVIYLDEIVVQQLIPTACSGGIPSIGIASSPSIVASGSTFNLLLSGNSLLYSGLQFKWQSSLQGANNFQDIPGANTQNYSTSQTVARDYRCIMTCTNSGSSMTSNVVTVLLPVSGALFREKHIGDVNLTSHIYGIHFLTASTGFVAFGDSLGFTSDSGQTFLKKGVSIANTNFNGFSNVNLTFGFSPRGVYAFSTDSLLFYGDYGAGPAILFSANQGVNWKLVFHQPFALNPDIGNSIFDMKFLTSTNGVAINQKYIIETIDRGQTWTIKLTVAANRVSNLAKLTVVSNANAYAVAGDHVYNRSGGAWFEISTALPDNPGLNYSNISFSSPARGFISRDDNGAVYRTNNSGSSWTRMNDTVLSPLYASDLYFTNDSTGFAAATELYNVLKTTDYGKTWELCKRNSGYQFASYGMDRLFFLNNQIGWVGGRGEYLMITTTGGSPTIPKAIFNIDTTNLTPTGNVNLLSGSKTYYQHSWYKNGIFISSSYNTSFTHDIFAERDTIKLVVNNGVDSDSLTLYQDYNPYLQVPVITSFLPASAYENTSINISGIGFTGATNVTFGNIPALSFIVNSNTSINAIVAGGSSGEVAVTTGSGTGSKSGFTFNLLPAPVITSFTPASGPIGTVVTITGSQFNPSTTGNIVFFGKMKAEILSATVNQVTCKVPAGASYDPIIIINLSNHLSASSTTAFNITFPGNGTITTNSFFKVLDIATLTSTSQNMSPVYLSAGDLDGDGKNDVVVSALYNSYDSIFIYKNSSTAGNISFGPRINIAYGDNAAFCSIADIDNDGKPDLSFVGSDHSLNILRNTSNNGNITFDTPVYPMTIFEPEELSVRDLNGDGKPEMLIAVYGPSKLAILRNVSVGSTIRFAPIVEFTAPGNIRSVATGDIDGDGKPDVVAGGNSNIFSVYRNISGAQDINFSPRIDLTGTGNVSRVLVSDIDNNGKPDVIISYITGTTAFSVFKNTSTVGNISFAARQDYISIGTESVSSGEINNFSGDNLPDIFTGNSNFFKFHLHKNISNPGTVNFNAAIEYGSNRVIFLCSSDFDNDGKPDVAIPDVAYNVVSFYRNRVNEPVNTIICPMASSINLNSNIVGSSYRWQIYTGGNYIDLIDNATYTGTQTSSLIINGAPTSWYGYKYRCLVNGNIYSDEFSLKFEATWTGATNTAWENPANWGCGSLPDAYTDVVIPSGTVIVNSNVTIRSLALKLNVNFTVHPGFNFIILD